MTQFNINKILNIGIALTAQRDMTQLLDTIVNEAMSVTNADAGTLYIYEKNTLLFKIMRNKTMNTCRGADGEVIDLPAVEMTEQNVCSFAAIHKELENIQDVYDCEKFDFSGPKKYDNITGYKTKSMLVVPLENNKGEVVGVLQLINAMDNKGSIIAFDKEFEFIFRSFAAQAAIAVTNMRYTKEIKDTLYSLIEVMSVAVDERTPYNAKHTRNVALYTIAFVEYINQLYSENKCSISFDDDTKEQIIMAAWLHDIGKIVTPLEVMNKATRLDPNFEKVMTRFEIMQLNNRIEFLSEKITKEVYEEKVEMIQEAIELVTYMDGASFVTEENIAQVKNVAERLYVNNQGQTEPWLSAEEVYHLSIQKGTLTTEERQVMQNHVVVTQKLLSKIQFTSDLSKVPLIAGSHHERLNGKGYPDGLSAEDLTLEMRILPIMDIFEALTAADRPYKSGQKVERAFEIIDEMVEEGDIDGDLVSIFKTSNIWESIKKRMEQS